MKKEILLNKVIDKIDDLKIEAKNIKKKKKLKKMFSLIVRINIILEKENRKNEKE